MKLEQQIEDARSTVNAFLSDLENPHRINAAIQHREEQINKLQQEINELRASSGKLPQLYKEAADRLKRLTAEKQLQDNKALQELLKLQKRVDAQIKDLSK